MICHTLRGIQNESVALSKLTRNANVSVDMLRAFVTLAECLNLTRASETLKVTRQTVRRHITDLEEIKGEKLFTLHRHEYSLTQFGAESIPEAKSILRQIEGWSGSTNLARRSAKFLESAEYTDSDGRRFYSQQHSISTIAINGLPIMKAALAAWGNAQTQIEDPAMEVIRPYLVVYRKSAGGWICVEIGEKSAYAKWFGWAWSKSAIGRLSQEDNAGDDYNDFIAGAYARIYSEGGVRLDHIYAHLPRESSDDPVPVTFQRMLMGCVFPDETPALAVLVLMTNQFEINDMENNDLKPVPENLLMDFEI